MLNNICIIIILIVVNNMYVIHIYIMLNNIYIINIIMFVILVRVGCWVWVGLRACDSERISRGPQPTSTRNLASMRIRN